MEGGGEGTQSKDSSPPAPPALKKGPWTAEEDAVLIEHVRKNGEGNWNSVQRSTGLARCGKSCRLRWANHLRPNLKKGQLTPEEELLVLRLHAQLGNKWARMAAQLPGRTDNEIKNYWNTRLKRRQRAGMPLYPPSILHCHRPPQLLVPSSAATTTTTAAVPPPSSPVLFNSTMIPTMMMFSPLSSAMQQQLAEVPRWAKRAREDDETMMFRFPVSPAPSVVPRMWHTAPSTPTGRTMFDYSIMPPMTPPMPTSAYSMLEHSSSSKYELDRGGEVELMDKLLQEEERRAAGGDHRALNCAGGEAFVGLEELEYCRSSAPFPTNYSHESNHLWIGEMIPTQQHGAAAATPTPADWNNSDRSDVSNGGQSVLTNDDLTVDQHQLAPSLSPTTLRWNQTGTISPSSSNAPDWNITSCHWNNMPELA